MKSEARKVRREERKKTQSITKHEINHSKVKEIATAAKWKT